MAWEIIERGGWGRWGEEEEEEEVITHRRVLEIFLELARLSFVIPVFSGSCLSG